MVLDDDLVEIMDKNPDERTPEAREAYINYLKTVWAMPTMGSKKETDHKAEES